MHNIKDIRLNPDQFKKDLSNRFADIDLKERRKYVVIIIFTAAAILTPPDPVTQIGLAIPLLILYELSIFSVNIIEKKIKEKENA